MFLEKLRRLYESLKIWNKDMLGYIDQKISCLRHELNEMELDSRRAVRREDSQPERNCHEIILALNNKKSLLSQKAKLRWIKDGDANSSFFHQAINSISNNGIMALETEGGWIKEQVEVKRVVRGYFRNQFR